MAALLRPRHRRIMTKNLKQTGLFRITLLVASAREFGKNLLELAPIWLRPYSHILGWVREVHGWEHVEKALHQGKGILLLGPHLGCLELAGLYIASKIPVTALYRPPRQEWAHALMQTGRARGYLRMAEPNLKGVRALLTALRRNEAAWVLPDQSANSGEGQWVRFFGQWAYMPTLLYRLRAATGATPLIFTCERLGFGRGFKLLIHPLPDLPSDQVLAAALVNNEIEQLIRRVPSQYLWSYRLFRGHADAPPPPEDSK